MHRSISAALCLALLLAPAAPAGATEPETDEQKTLYALGLVLSRNLQQFNLTEKELALVEYARDLLRKVGHAETVIQKGTYGICESCQSAIPVARLEVLPYTTLCVSCSGKR